MNILFLGDIFGRPGRKATKELLPELKKKHNINLTIANGENLSHGKGITVGTIKEMQDAGVDFFTTGNHVWRNKDGVAKLDDKSFPVIRPANFPKNGVPGRGYEIIEDNMMRKVLVINLLGRVFSLKHIDCPFRRVEEILEETKNENISAIFVDFHADATSEKVAMGHFLDGKVSAVIGTHTHIATRDDRILENGTAYMTDVGMVGPFDSVIGVEKEIILKQFLTQLPIRHEVAKGPVIFSAVKIEVDDKTRKAKSLEYIREFLEE